LSIRANKEPNMALQPTRERLAIFLQGRATRG
jgi:hypothetical protein